LHPLPAPSPTRRSSDLEPKAMLFTRCPHCDTIFRVTDEALAKAGGRVRCGRCANVFDATADLRESPDGAAIVRPSAASAAASTRDRKSTRLNSSHVQTS